MTIKGTSVSMDLRVKKKRAFSISSKDLANAVADYTASGGKITQLKIRGKIEADTRVQESK